MAKDKYTLPEVDSLKKIGFQFEYAKLDEAIPYIQSFVDANIESLILLYYPDQYIYDDDGNTVDLIRWADPNMFDDVLYDEKAEKEIIDKIIRIEIDYLRPLIGNLGLYMELPEILFIEGASGILTLF
jgi:hypothetical protein